MRRFARFAAPLALACALFAPGCERTPRQELPYQVERLMKLAGPWDVERAGDTPGSWGEAATALDLEEEGRLMVELRAAVDARRYDDPELVAVLSPAYRLTARFGGQTLELVLHRPPANRLEYSVIPDGPTGWVNVDGGALRALERLLAGRDSQ